MDESLPRKMTLEVVGMTCDDCVTHVTTALQEAGADQVSVSLELGSAVFMMGADTSEDRLRSGVANAGYTPGILKFEQQRTALIPSHDVDYDLIVIGAGSAAFAAAIKGTEAGYRVALVEKGLIGGTCVNIGCVPSKALLVAGSLAWEAGHHPFTGLATTSGPIDLKSIIAQKDELVGALRQSKYLDLIDDYGFEVLTGHASFTGPNTIEVDGSTLTAQIFIVATGASPAAPPIPGLLDAGFLTSTTALELTEIPRRLIVIGANAIGLELGQFFLNIGSNVTFIDVADRIAPFEELEVSSSMTEILTSAGATIHTTAKVTSVSIAGAERIVHITVDGADLEIPADQILVATGRRPNTAGLGLDKAGVLTDERGSVVVDAELRTLNPRIFAAGDVTGAPQFVYVSAYQGALASDNALGHAGRTVDLTGLPRVTFTSPQIASAGLTERQAIDAGYNVKTSVLPLDAVPRALVNRDIHGLVKLVADVSTDRLLGASIVGEGAGDVIQSAVLAIRFGITIPELAATFHPYLTMAEGLKLAAQTFTRDIHKLSCCAA